jgi:twinkle protein
MLIIDSKTKEEFEIHPNRPSGQKKLVCPACSPNRKKQNDPSLSFDFENGVGQCHNDDCQRSFVVKQDRPVKQDLTVDRKGISSATPVSEFLQELLDRGISKETIQRNDLQEGQAFMPQVGAKALTLQFPYKVAGREVNRKYRTANKEMKQQQGANPVFWGLDDVRAENTAIIVEGEFDKLAFEEAGFTNVLSVPQGAPGGKSTDKWAQFITNSWPHIKHIREFIICPDQDDAGQTLIEILGARLGRENCRIADLPAKDPNDVLLQVGSQALHDAVLQARPFPLSGVISFSEKRAEIDQLFNEGLQKESYTHYPMLDEYLDIRRGFLSTWVGIPGHGKSEFINQLMVKLAGEDWRFALYSPEHPASMNFQKLAKTYNGKPFFPRQDGNRGNQMSEAEKEEALDLFSSRIYTVWPETDMHDIDSIIAVTRQLVQERGIHCLVIDPFNHIDHNYYQDHYHIGRALSKLNRLKLEANIHIAIVAHPTKLQKNQETGLYPLVKQYDIDGSAHWNNKSDIICSIYRNGQDDATELHILKMKFEGILGHTGQIDYEFRPQEGRFYEYHESGDRVYDRRAKQSATKAEAMPEEPPF